MPINKTPWQQPVSSRQRKGTEAISPYIAKPEPYLQNTLKKSRKQMYDTVDRQSHALRDFVRTKEHTDSPSPIRRTIDDSIGSGMDWAKENPDFNYQSQDDYEWDRTKEDLADLYVDLHTFKYKEFPEAFSDLMQDLNLTGSSTTAGKIGINKDRQASAELYKGVLELDDQLDNLLNQRDYLEDAYKKNPNDEDILKKLNDVYTKINQVATTLDSDEVKQIRKDYQTNVGDSGLDGIWNRMKLFAQDTATKFAHLQINDTYDSITKENARLEANHAKARREQFDKFKQETLDDLSEEERRMYNSLPAEQQKKYLDRVVNSNYIKKLDDENKELIKDYNEDIADAADWQRWIPVSKSFNEKKRKAQDASLLDPRYYMYAAPSTIGSSFSSPYQAASMAIRAGGAVGGGVLTATGNAGAGAALYNVAETVATFTDTAAGFDENYAEVADRSAGILAAQLNQMPEGKDILEDLRKQSVKKRIALGYSKKEAEEISDEDVAKDALAGLTKTTHPYYKVAEMAALEGSQAQFWRDNMATMGETFQSYLIQLMPQGNARSLWNAGVRQIKKGATKAGEKIGGKIGKSVVNWAKDKEGNLVAAGINETEEFAQRRAAQALDDAVEDGSESMYKSVKNRAKGYFKKGESLGETAAQLTGQGYVGQLAYGKTAGAVGTALGFAADGLKTVGGKLVPQAVKDGARSFQKFLISNYHTIGNKILPSIVSKDLAKYGLNLAWKGAVSAFNEGAEEGRQYLNSKADYSGYGHSFDPLLNLPNLLISDFVNGARVGQSYLAMLGIGSSPLLDDAEYIQNVKGGFALGGMNTSVINVATRIPGMVRQISTDSYIENSGVFTRDADQNNRAQYSAFAKTAAKGKVQETLHAMDMMRKRDLSSKSPQFTEEEWDRHVQDATTVMMNANNPILRNKLEAKGIQYGSDEYFNAIADYTIQVQNHNANVQEATELANKMRQNYESKEFDDDVREQVRQTNQGSQVEELGKRFGVETAEQEQSEAIAKLNEQAKVKKGNSKHKRAMSEEAAQELDALLEQEMEMSDEDRAAIQEQNESKGIDEVNNALGLYDSLKAKTILVSRLKGLLKLRAQANTVDDYFKMLRDNFKLKIARPDAKTVSESISRQIDEVKEQLKELTDVSLEGKDGDVLENLDNIETVGKWVEALEEDERANALLAADREVTQKYIDLFNEGLTEDKDDKGNKTGRYTFDKTKKNRYKDYISKVMSAKTRSTAVNWAVNDAFAGNLEDEVKPEKGTTEDSKRITIKTKGTTEDSKKTKGTKKYVAPFTGAVDITTENPIMAVDETELQMLTSLAVNKSKKGKYSFKDYLDDIKTYYNDKVISDAEEQLKAIYVSASVQPEAKAENLEDMATVLQFDQANYLIPKQQVSNATLAEKLNEINAKVIDDLSNYYDTFVKNDDGTVTVYTNTVRVNEPQYGDGNNFPSLTEDVQNTLDVNTDEEFKQALEHLSDKYNFDVTKYSDYRYVNGIDKIIARAIINNLEQQNPSIKKANYAKETVTNILLGKPVSQEAKDNILNYDEFVRQINALKERFAKAKLSIVDTPICIYGTNSKGQNSFTNSDLLLEDENGNIYIYYVRTSYKDVRGTMHDKTNRNYSDYEYFYKTLSNETEILTNNFDVTINGIGVIPIQAPARSEKSSMDLKEPIAITSAGINNIQPSQQDLSQLQQKYDDFINQYNEKVTTYNSLVQQLGLYGITLPQKNIIASTVFTTVMELQANTESIINNTSSLQSEIDSLNEKLQNAVLNATSQYERVTGIEPVGTQPEDVENKVDALQGRCVQLDHLLQQMPDAKAVTAEDKQNVKDLISLVIDTQTRFDELVSTEDVQNIPMFHERQLISVAMERLYKNKENWGIEHMFVPMKNWWLTKVVIADGSLPVKVNETKYLNAVINGQNTTTGNILYTYLNQIGLWKNSLSDLISLSLQEDEKLQQWYGTLLNTYLQTLIDNALALAERPELKDTDAANVLRGLVNGNGFEEDGIQILIDNFNRQYPNAVPTAKQKADDLKVLDQTAIQINNLPTSWYENGYSQDSHRLDIFAIKNNIDLYTQISTDPEFDPNKYCTLITKGGLPYLHIDFKNKQLDVPIYVPSDYQHKDPNGKSDEFIIKVNAVLDYVKKHPGTHMKVNIVRNNPGYAMYSDNATHNVTEDLIPEEDLYTITFDKDQIGIVTATVGNGMTTYSIKNGQSFNNTIDVLNERRDRIHNGSIVYMKYDTQLEKTNAHQPTPLILQSDTFGAMKDSKDVFVGIINAMRDIQDGKQTLVKDGVTINLYDMLSMCLQMKDQDKYGQLQDVSGVVSIDRYGVRIGRDAISKTGIPLDLKNNDGIQRMLTKLGTMSSRYGNKKILNERLSTSNFSIFKEIRNNLNEFKGNKSDWSFKLPNGFVFTADDFEHKNSDGTFGLTWIGYLLKYGYLKTRYTGNRNYANMWVSSPSIELDVKETSFEASVDNSLQMAKQRHDLLASLLDKRAKISSTHKMSKEEEKAAIDYLKSVFGEKFAQKAKELMTNTYIEQLGADGAVIGKCTQDAILLSRQTVTGVTYHEAFHRVLELLLPDKIRESVYKSYRKSNGQHLSDVEVAEGLADEYMDWKNGLDEALSNVTSKYKIIKAFKKLAATIKYLKNTGVGKVQLIAGLMGLGAPKYMKATDARRKRFEEKFGSLNYEIQNTDTKKVAKLRSISSSDQLNAAIDGLIPFLLSAQKIDITGLGDNIKDLKIDGLTPNKIPAKTMNILKNPQFNPRGYLLFQEIFTKKIIEQKDEQTGQIKYIDTYPVFEVLSQKIMQKIDDFTGGHKKVLTDEEYMQQADSYTGEEDTNDAHIGDHIKAAYESKRLDTATKRVKFFFGTIVYSVFEKEKDQNGKDVLTTTFDSSKNMYGLPQFMPINEVFGELVNRVNKVQNARELLEVLEKISTEKPLFMQIYKKFSALYNKQYYKDENGNLKINYDAEATVTQIFQTLKSQIMDFQLSSSKSSAKGTTVKINSSSYDTDQHRFPRDWSMMLASGATGVVSTQKDENGNYMFNRNDNGERYDAKDGKDIFSYTADYLQSLKQQISAYGDIKKINGLNINLNDPVLLQSLLKDVVAHLNKIGIMVDIDGIEYMLSHQYGGNNITGLTKWLNSEGLNSFGKFITFLNSIIDNNTGTLNPEIRKNFDKLYDVIQTKDKQGNITYKGGSGFVINLAINQAAANRTKTDLMVMATKDNRYYSVSQNNTISDICDILSRNDETDSEIKRLKAFNYNVIQDGSNVIGSVILKNLIANNLNIQLKNFAGFKSDNKGDLGSDYYQINEVEDYISKMAILLQDGIIFPTMSDKKTYTFITGIKLPGIDYSANIETIAAQLPRIENAKSMYNGVLSNTMFVQNNAVLDQFIEYAICERAAIQKCIEDLDKNNPNKIPESKRVQNYYTNNIFIDKDGNEHVVEPNGTRFSSLTQIDVEEDGKVNTYFLNDPTKSSKDCLALADEKFFNKSKEEQRQIIARSLFKHVKLEIDKCIRLGLITKDNTGNLKNVSLDYEKLDLIRQAIDKNEAYNAYNKEAKETLAIYTLLFDVNSKSIMSIQEVERIFAGHPAFYKWNYGYDSKGNPCLVDRFVDEQKRLGGLISTGNNNRTDLPKVTLYRNGVLTELTEDESFTYNCANIADNKVSSTADRIGDFGEYFKRGELLELVLNVSSIDRLEESIYSSADNQLNATYQDGTIKSDYIIDYLKKHKVSQDKIDSALKRADDSLKSYTKKKNKVADGSAFITDAMAETLLRQLGLYSNHVRKAFEILRNPKTAYDYKRNEKAYHTVFEAVIGAQKYSAFGHRDGFEGVLVPHYDKFALFPLFPSVATGKMHDMYEKMKRESVDMVMMDSAVKIGIEGSVSEDDSTSEDKPFNVYKQEFRYLRKQLNTDPNGKAKMALGTQMVKVALYNLIDDLTYHDENGNAVTGAELKQKLFNAINKLTESGYNKFMSQFYKDGSTEIDPDKLSKFLNEELTSRSANKNLIEAIQVVEENGVRRLRMPLAATSDSNWIESIITSKINKQIVDIITPGNAFYQRSVFQMEGDNKDVESGTIREDDGTIYNGKNLQILNEEGSMDAVISIDYFEHIIPKNLKTFEEQRQWLIDNNIIGSNAHSNTIASRVPTQAESSINPLRFVDVIAGVKDTIILPKDFTTLTGSDFDIDKLYLATLNYNISKDGKASTEFEEGSDEYYQNQLLNVYMTLLKDPNTRHITYRSIDNDTGLVESPAHKVSKSQTNDNSTLAYNFYTLHEQTERKNDYITGKISIGPFALNVTNHALTMAFHVKFKDSVISKIIGINDLDLRRDVDGNAIGSWLSAFINAHVDIVKDPYISVMNINTYTYNMINLLVRTGKGVAGLNFICNPIIRDMASAYINASGEFGRNSRVSKFQAQKDAVKNVILKYAQIDPKDTKKADAFFEDIEKETSPNNRKDKLEELGRLVNEVLAGENKDQIDVYKAWLVLDKYAKALSRMVAVTKIDTKKQGNTLLAQAAYEQKYNDFFLTGDFWDNPMNKKLKEDRIKDMIFDYGSIDYFRNKSFIASKTELAISAMRNVLYGQSFAANKQYLRKVYDVVSTQALSTEPNEQLLGKIDKAIQTKIKTDAVLRWAYQNSIRVKDGSFDFKSIFFGNRSVANRINRLKTEIARPGSKYARLASNSLLKQIVVQPSKDNIVGSKKVGGYEYPQTLTLFHGLDEDKTNQDSLIEAWDDLLHDSDENVVMLANELVLYAWLTSGNYQGFNKFFKYVPNSWREESGFADYVANRISSDLDFIDKEFIDDVIRNNWNEPGLIRNYTVNSGKQNSLVGYKNSALPYSDPIVIAGLHQDGRVVIEPNESGNFPRFIKVKSVIDRSYDENGYRLYKLVGTRQIKGKPVPIYVMDRQRGIHLIGVDIYEYGRLDGYDITDDPAMHFDGYQIQQFADKLEETLSRYNEVSLPTILSSDINGFSASLFMQRDSFDGGSAVVPSVQQQVTSGLKEGDTTDHHTYIGNIQPSDDTVFVFGSNPIGVNGRLDAYGQGKDSGGAAAVAQRHFGVKQGELMNNKMSESGKAYGLVTVTAPGAKQSLSLTQIAENFSKMFDVARQNPDKKFKVAFRNTNTATLNGYTGQMLAVAVMTSGQTVPNNVYFSEEWYNAGYVYNFKFDDPVVNNNTTGKVQWARYADNSYEVSSKNDSRFSAMYATFKPGTTLFGHDVSGRTIESVYQHGVKQGDWNTDNNNETGAPKDKSIITGNTEDDSYSQGYLPLWQEWAKQNPELIEELRKLSEGKTLTDQFASTRVSQARALDDILNSTEPNKKNESEFESKGTTIGDDFLNEGQKEARDKIVNFIKERLNETGIRNTDDKDYPYFCLSGMAGTGKTTLINSVIGQLQADAAEGKNRFVRVIVGAISHKATQVIAGKIDPKYNAKAASVASILGMTLDETTGEFKQNPMAKSIITYNSVVIIDEASMVSEQAMDLLIEECKQNNSPLIFIGDEGQLPPIRNGKNSQSDEISPAFKTENKSILKERIRQGEGNPILEYADYFWRYSVLGGEDNVYLSSELNNKLKEKYNAQGVMTYFNETDISKLNSIFKEAVDTRNPNLVKIVAYTNEARTNWNNTIRYSMFGENARTLQNGEILTAFNTIQDNTDPKHPKLICMNSKDYIVSDISGFRTENIFGTDIDVVDVTISSVDEHGEEVKVTTTIINPNIDSLYKYRSALDRNIKKVMSMRPRDKYSYQYQEWKRGVLKDHWNQVNKYPVLEYGYAITSHKSQGSTYDVVVVDSKDIESVGSISWKSKARSIYTALTRARNISIVMRDKKNEGGYNIKALNDRLNQLKGNNKFNDPNEVDDTEMRTCKNK